MSSAIEKTGVYKVDTNKTELKHKVTSTRESKINTKNTEYRACPLLNFDGLHGGVSLSYLALTDDRNSTPVAFRIENERELENENNKASNALLCIITAFAVAVALILYAYLELFVFTRLNKIRRYVTKLSYNDDSGIFDDFDDTIDYFADELSGSGDSVGGGVGGVGDSTTRDEINRLKFMTKKRMEFLKRRHSEALTTLVEQSGRNEAILEATKLAVLVRGRPQKQFFSNIPHYSQERIQQFALRDAFRTPVALEMFKDYCARKEKEALLCVFFVLDVFWLKILEEMYPRRRGMHSPLTVEAARTVGRNYFANKTAKPIVFKKATKNKILKLQNYEPGMYDTAMEEAMAKIEDAFENYRGTHDFLNMLFLYDVFCG